MKHFLVVGGTKGSGMVFVRKILQEGNQASVIGRSKPLESHYKLSYWQLDLLDSGRIKSTLDDIIQKNGKIDSLVFFQRYRGNEDPWKNELEVTLSATREIIEHLSDKFNDNGSITIVSSIIGNFVVSEQGAGPQIAKAGLNHLIRFYAVRLGPRKIRVNGVSPCAIIKPESREYYTNNILLNKLYEEITPLKRMGTSEDLAKAISFFCSDDASFITGQNIIMDGGVSLQGHEALARALTVDKQKQEKSIVKRRTDCRLCESKNTEIVFKLEPTPIADQYLPFAEKDKSKERYPLDLLFCKDCAHLQLVDIIDPKVLYENYTYVSSSSLGLIEHFRKSSEKIIETYKPRPGSLVIDIGSNDGSLLKFFKERNMQVLGVDPAQEIAKRATDSGIKTIPNFFSLELSEKIKAEHGKAAVITANNVFAHADDLSNIVKGIRNLLAPGGVFLFEVSYLPHIIERMLFDTIYHEHLSYHSVKPLQTFFNRYGMELIDSEYIPTKGGSLRGTAQLKGDRNEVSPSVHQLIEMEERLGYDKPEIYRDFAKKMDEIKKLLASLLNRLRSEGKKIAGYGASHTVTTLTFHLDLGDKMSFIVDDNPNKLNTFSPGFHIPVYSSSKLYEEKPDYIVILAWQYAEPIIKKNMLYLQQGGQFIIPLPYPKIVNRDNFGL